MNYYLIILLIVTMSWPGDGWQTKAVRDDSSSEDTDSDSDSASDIAKNSTNFTNTRDSEGSPDSPDSDDSDESSEGVEIQVETVQRQQPTVCKRAKCDQLCKSEKWLEGRCVDNVCWCVKKD